MEDSTYTLMMTRGQCFTRVLKIRG